MATAYQGREIEWEAWHVEFARAVASAVAEYGGVAGRDSDRVWLGEVVVDVAAEFCGEREKGTVRVDGWGACARPWGIVNAHLEARSHSPEFLGDVKKL